MKIQAQNKIKNGKNTAKTKDLVHFGIIIENDTQTMKHRNEEQNGINESKKPKKFFSFQMTSTRVALALN